MVHPKVGTLGALVQTNRLKRKKSLAHLAAVHHDAQGVKKPPGALTTTNPSTITPAPAGAAAAAQVKIDEEKREEAEESTDEEEDVEVVQNRRRQPQRRSQKIDWEDCFLTYGMVDNKRPHFFEQYSGGFPCFHGCTPTIPRIDVKTVNRCLLDYVNDVWKTYTPPAAKGHLNMRATTNSTNICFSPLQAIRAWGLLSNLAINKTLDDLGIFIEKYTGGTFNSVDEINTELLNLHVTAEDDFDGAVRLFTELPRHLQHNSNVRLTGNAYYGGKSQRSAIQHHSFSTDSDGFYSCYRINQEMMLSTNGALRYVVPEHAAPNWRASIALASAIDCTFFWLTSPGPMETSTMKFSSTAGLPDSVCTGVYADAMIGIGQNMYKLESFLKGVSLFIVVESAADVTNSEKHMPRDLVDTLLATQWRMETRKVLIPKCTTSAPISLFKHAKSNGLTRIFSSEKAELHELQASNAFEGHANFITLFDHYHKANFEIMAARPTPLDRLAFDDFSATRAHQYVDEHSLFDEFQTEENEVSKNKMIFTYFEDHLDRNPRCMEQFDETIALTGTAPDIIIDTPFYYLMTREMANTQPILLCAGYFNNTMFVKQ
uniref:SERPIN domain-containing protein n=3 Tax=Caenorhabditis japonica TaxID=281687 RepID=A0A8R1E2T4_CAEJA